MVFLAAFACVCQAAHSLHLEIEAARTPEYFMAVEWPKIVGPGSGGLLLKDFADRCKISIDDAKNAIVLDGPVDLVTKMKDVIGFFNIAPRLIKLRMDCSWPKKGLSFSSSATIDNDSQWHSGWDAMGLDVTLHPRINRDGTVSVRVDTVLGGPKTMMMVRLKSGAKQTLSPYDRSKEEGPAITIKATIG